MPQCVLGLGSNIGNSLDHLNHAIEAISLLPNTKIIKCSQTYITPAWGVTDQSDFYNRNVLIETELSPNALLGACLGIEAGIGRKRIRHWGERSIDIDLLIYEGVSMTSSELTLPHPYMLERAFVLIPMLDLFEDGIALGISFNEALSKLDTADIHKID